MGQAGKSRERQQTPEVASGPTTGTEGNESEASNSRKRPANSEREGLNPETQRAMEQAQSEETAKQARTESGGSDHMDVNQFSFQLTRLGSDMSYIEARVQSLYHLSREVRQQSIHTADIYSPPSSD